MPPCPRPDDGRDLGDPSDAELERLERLVAGLPVAIDAKRVALLRAVVK